MVSCIMSIKDIKATLKYGKFIFGKKMIVLYIATISPLLMPFSSILAIFLIAFNVFSLDKDMIFPIIYGNIFCVSVSLISLFYIFRYKKINAEVKKWLEDAVLIKADIFRLDSHPNDFKPYQIEVVFFIDGKKKVKISDKGNAIIGYNKWLLRFAGNNCQILYSRKFDQVMLV